MENLDDMDFTRSAIIRFINKWLYVYQNNDRSISYVQQELQAGLDTVTSWVDKNRHFFKDNIDLLPRRYFNLPENKLLLGRCTTIDAGSTYMLSIGEFLTAYHPYSITDRDRELRKLKRGINNV